MGRQVQVGDNVQISSGQNTDMYKIVKIDNLDIYISSPGSNDLHLLRPGPDGYRVHGTNMLYKIEFLPGSDESEGLELTGDPNVDIHILSHLDDISLKRMCRINSYIRNLCNRDELWIAKIENVWGLDMLRWIPNNYQEVYNELKEGISLSPDLDELARLAIEENKPYMLEFINEMDRSVITEELADLAIDHDSLEALQWLTENGHKMIEWNYALALSNGSVRIVQWLYDMFPNTDPMIGILDLNENTLTILKWLAEPPRNYLPGSDLYDVAYQEDRLDIFEWMENQGVPVEAPDESVGYGPISLLEWYEDKGFLPDHEVANFAVTEYIFDVVDWLANKGILPTSDVYQTLDHRVDNYPSETNQMFAKLEELGVSREN